MQRLSLQRACRFFSSGGVEPPKILSTTEINGFTIKEMETPFVPQPLKPKRMLFVPGARTVPSRDAEEARKRVINLYREWIRLAPDMVSRYPLNIPTHRLRARIRQGFERNRNVHDLAVIDMLILKGTQELIEAAEVWKQLNHVMAYFDLDTEGIGKRVPVSPHSSGDKFMDDFYENRSS